MAFQGACFAQRSLPRPQKNQTTSSSPKSQSQQSNTNKSSSSKSTTSKSTKSTGQSSNTSKVVSNNINSVENINGFTVRWNGVNQNQKNEITKLVRNMVYVDGGYFYMGGSDSDAYEDEKPRHEEFVDSFNIGRYEVTQGLWDAVMGYNPSISKGKNKPVENVSWDECQTFIRKLNKLTGLNFRLPTESEWEFAARGGNYSRGYKYAGSNDASSVGWISTNSDGKTHDVGGKSSNELGLYDMTGNVWEWTSQKWSPNYNSSRTGEQYVRRGGSVSRPAKFCRVSYRNRGDKVDNGKYYGLRLVLN